MAISVYLGKVTKRKNSTFRPSLTAAVNVVLKEGTSDTRPAFLLNSSEPVDANYLVWGDRYYFIDDVTYERNNLYTIRCSLDVLATYKSYIAATTAFVMYDPTANTELVDTRLSAETTATVQRSEGRFNNLGRDVCAVVTVTGASTTAAFAMDIESAAGLMNNVNDWLDTADGLPYPPIQQIEDIGETIQIFCYNVVGCVRQLIATGNVNEAVKSAILIPLPKSMIGTGPYTIRLGNYRSSMTGNLVAPQNRFLDAVTLPIPWQANDWRRNSPFHELYLFLPHIGVIPISPSDVMGSENLYVYINMSMMTGDAIFKAVAANGHTVGQWHTNLSSPFAIGSSNLSPYQAVTAMGSALVTGATAIASGGTSAMIAGAAGIIGQTSNLVGTPATVGSNAGGALVSAGESELTLRLVSIYHDTNVAPNSVAGAIGTPTMAVRVLGSLSGYVECQAASVSAPAESAVLEQINGYVNGGFFME